MNETHGMNQTGDDPDTPQLLLDIFPRPEPTLESFVAGANQAAVDAVRTLAPGRALYLWGGPGSGRSHLLRARSHGARARYFTATQAARHLGALALDEQGELDLVAIDDADQLSEAGCAGLFALFNRWRASARSPQAFALLTAGSQAPRTLALREDLRSRLGWDLVFRLTHLSDEERAEALRARARARGLDLPDAMLRWMLTHTARDMGRLSTLIDALDRYSLARHRPITLPLLKDLLAQHPASGPS